MQKLDLVNTNKLHHAQKNFNVNWIGTGLCEPTLRGTLMLFNMIKHKDKCQFVNSVKLLVFDLTKIPFLKRLISISHLIVEVLSDQNLLTESNLANWFSSYVQFCSGGHYSKRAEAAR